MEFVLNLLKDSTSAFFVALAAALGRNRDNDEKTTRAANVVVVLANNESMLLDLLVVQGVSTPWFLYLIILCPYEQGICKKYACLRLGMPRRTSPIEIVSII